LYRGPGLLKRDDHPSLIERWHHVGPVKLNPDELAVRRHSEFQVGQLLAMQEQPQSVQPGTARVQDRGQADVADDADLEALE
jgi:hypothetical protein